MAGAMGFYGWIHAKFDAGTEPAGLNANALSLRAQRQAHRHRVASILRTATPNFTSLIPSDKDIGMGLLAPFLGKDWQIAERECPTLASEAVERVPKKLFDFFDSNMLPLFGFVRFLPVTESHVIWKRSWFGSGGLAPEGNP